MSGAQYPSVSMRCPAKLNLFLELLGKRDDGFHEIDTVMVPIDLTDTLTITQSADPGIRLGLDWLPSRRAWLADLGFAANAVLPLAMQIPVDRSNLVVRGIEKFCAAFDVPPAFEVKLQKRIPAGAGMGGASSNAAAALLAMRQLCGVPRSPSLLRPIAAELGSDVPFFLGSDVQQDDENHPDHGVILAGWATGRGEKIAKIDLARPLHFVVVYPGILLSTAKVYAASKIHANPKSSSELRALLADPGESALLHTGQIGQALTNRLSEPAQEIEPRIAEILDSMWQASLKACQLTGSGSACFGLATSPEAALVAADMLRRELTPGAIVMTSRSSPVPF